LLSKLTVVKKINLLAMELLSASAMELLSASLSPLLLLFSCALLAFPHLSTNSPVVSVFDAVLLDLFSLARIGSSYGL